MINHNLNLKCRIEAAIDTAIESGEHNVAYCLSLLLDLVVERQRQERVEGHGEC